MTTKFPSLFNVWEIEHEEFTGDGVSVYEKATFIGKIRRKDKLSLTYSYRSGSEALSGVCRKYIAWYVFFN